MCGQYALNQTYLFIRKNRFNRKKRLYNMAFGVMIDKTIAVYLLVLLGYFIASLFIMGDVITEFDKYFTDIEAYMIKYLSLIPTIIPIKSIFQSFSKPGIIYSTSEHQLSFLPYSKKKIWFMAVLEKWLKTISLYILASLIIISFTPLSWTIITMLFLFIMFMNILMTIPQWMLYQKGFIQKVGWLLVFVSLNSINLAFELWWIGIVVCVVLLCVNLYLRGKIFKQINWSKVTEISDFTIWNMPLISKASDVKLKRQKKYSFFQNLSFRKKPFNYKIKPIHRKVWSLYLAKNTVLIIQFIGAIIVLLGVLMFIKPLLFPIGLAFSLHSYTAILASFFIGRFDADVLQVLPWNLSDYKATFLKWSNYGGLILIIPIIIAMSINATIWFPVQLVFYITVYYFLYHVKINKAILLLAKEHRTTDLTDTIGYILLLCVIFSVSYPVLSLGFTIVIWLNKREKMINAEANPDSPF